MSSSVSESSLPSEEPEDMRVTVGGIEGFGDLADPSNTTALLETGVVSLYMHWAAMYEGAYDVTWIPGVNDAGLLPGIAEVFSGTGGGVVELNDNTGQTDAEVNSYFQGILVGAVQDQGFAPVEANVNLDDYTDQTSLEAFQQFVTIGESYGLQNFAPIFSPNNLSGDLSSFLNPDWVFVRDDALLGGGLATDAPPSFYFNCGSLTSEYETFTQQEIKWAVSQGLRMSVIISPYGSGTNFLKLTEQFVRNLTNEGVIPTQWDVENYDVNVPSSYVNVVGSEATPDTIANVALWIAQNAPITEYTFSQSGAWTGSEIVTPSGQVLNSTDLQGNTTSYTDTIANYMSTIPCFLEGTRLATPAGGVPVERLARGDLVLTAGGETRPIVWIGHRRIACTRHPAPEAVLPVRISVGAFAPGLPRRDVVLSPDHALLAGDRGVQGSHAVLIPVKHLINGISIRQEPAVTVHYFHVELASHDVLLSEGLPVESYLDSGNRNEFANGGGAIVLHPALTPTPNPARCAPLCVSGPIVAETKRMLLARLKHKGHTLTESPDLALVADGRSTRPAAIRGRLYRFLAPAGTRDFRIRSRAGVPAEVDPESEDRRRLGVAVAGLLIDGRPIPLNAPGLGTGFYSVEQDGVKGWRWTNGNAALTLPPAPAISERRVVEVLIAASARSWVPAPLVRAALGTQNRRSRC